jgi:hypothetical protein
MKREAAKAMNLGSATVAGAEPHVLRILGPLEHGIRKPVGIVETQEYNRNAWRKQRNKNHRNFVEKGVWMSAGKTRETIVCVSFIRVLIKKANHHIKE